MTMGSSKATTWIVGAAFVAVVILAGSWFLFTSPVLAEAGETEEAAVAQDEKNDLEAVRIAALKKQFENIDEYRAELAQLREAVPTRPEHAEFQRQLAALSENHQVTVTALNVSASSEITIVLPETETTTTDGEDASADEAAEPAATSTEDAPSEEEIAAAALTGYYQVPMTMELVGTYRAVLDFVDELQTTNSRLYQVVGVDGTGLKAAEASAGRPATADGDLSVTVSGLLYVLLDPNAPMVDLDVEGPLELPVPVDGRNPMGG